jgi:hypothetical protein
MLLPVALLVIALAWFAFNHGLEYAGFYRGQSQQELFALREQTTQLTDENARLSEQVAQYERQIVVEQSRGEENAKLIGVLHGEIFGLQEDMAFYQNLTADQHKGNGVAIRQLELERDLVPGEYRVQMLLVQGGQRVKEFVGGYQLIGRVSNNGKTLLGFSRMARIVMTSFRLNSGTIGGLGRVCALSRMSNWRMCRFAYLSGMSLNPKLD